MHVRGGCIIMPVSTIALDCTPTHHTSFVMTIFPENKHLVLTTSSAWIGNNKLKSEVLGSTSQVPLEGTLYVHHLSLLEKKKRGACVHLLF
jgi:hypothetical protein